MHYTYLLKAKKIKINQKNFKYKLQRRRGARSVRLTIYSDGNFVVTAPKWYPLYVIRKFLEEKSEWIYERLKNIDFQKLDLKKQAERSAYKASKKVAEVLIKERVEFLNQHYAFSYNKITVKNQKTCWGSASRKGNLNFNYKVAGLPENLRDYVIVHELCHLKELNHGWKFWELVGETFPEYKKIRKDLRTHRI